MRIKQKPEDFKVEEIGVLKPASKGEYRLYLLEKRGLESFFVISYIAKKNSISVKEIGVAGLKDRHALTKQYITIPKKYNVKDITEKNFSLKFLGFVDRALKKGDMKGNRFEIRVKKASKVDRIINYFDSQRFGSVIANRFIGKFVLLNDYENAVKMYLTRYTKSENKDVVKEKKMIFKNWDRVAELDLKSGLRFVVDEIGNGWKNAYLKIPKKFRDFYDIVYQSYIWNECVKEIVKKRDYYIVKYDIGELYFTNEMDGLEFSEDVLKSVLKREMVRIDDFKFLKRKVVVAVKNFKFEKGVLSFELPSGSYATIVLKNIFSKDNYFNS